MFGAFSTCDIATFAKSLFFAEKIAISKLVARANVRQAARHDIIPNDQYCFDELSPKKISKHFEQFKVIISQLLALMCFRLVKAVGADFRNSPCRFSYEPSKFFVQLFNPDQISKISSRNFANPRKFE